MCGSMESEFLEAFREYNEGFVSGVGTFKFHSVNIKCRVGWDVPDGILMKALRGGVLSYV